MMGYHVVLYPGALHPNADIYILTTVALTWP